MAVSMNIISINHEQIVLTVSLARVGKQNTRLPVHIQSRHVTCASTETAGHVHVALQLFFFYSIRSNRTQQ